MYRPTGYIYQLAEYIQKNLDKGYTLDSLRFSLMSQGYSKISVEKAIEIANKNIAKTIPPIIEKPQIIYKVIDEKNQPIQISEIKPKKSFWKRIFSLD